MKTIKITGIAGWKTALIGFLSGGLFCSVASMAAEAPPEPLSDPIPEKIQPGIIVSAEEFLRVPRSAESATPPQTNNAYARIQYMQPLPDGSGRLAINDLRGVLYLSDESGATPSVFLDLRTQDIGFDDSMFPNETGLAGFAFHPDFDIAGRPGYGKLYTAYSASSDSGVADYLENESENHESVIREWTVNDPAANVFSGTSREIFRVGQFAQNHNIGTLAFNHAVARGDADYGMLYASFGDGGAANDPNENGQDLSNPLSSIIRIDPLDDDGDSAFGIPGDNPFTGRAGAAPEIWAYGLRHPQHFSFDTDGSMYIADIGQAQVEEINLGVSGANYGWRLREGLFATAFEPSFNNRARPNPVYAKPEDGTTLTYPVAQFDHDEGRAVSSVFVYRGSGIPALVGNLIFTDMVTGRVFYADGSSLVSGSPVTIQELSIRIEGSVQNIASAVGFPNTYSRGNRSGLRLGIDSAGELYMLTKGDGWIRKLVAD